MIENDWKTPKNCKKLPKNYLKNSIECGVSFEDLPNKINVENMAEKWSTESLIWTIKNNKNTGKTEQNFLGFRCEFAAFFSPQFLTKTTRKTDGKIRKVLEAVASENSVDLNIGYLNNLDIYFLLF